MTLGSCAVGSGMIPPRQAPIDVESLRLLKGDSHLRPRTILDASGSRSEEIHVQLSAISGLLWEGEVPGDGSRVFGFVLREAVVALQQHPGVLTLLIDTMVLSPSNALGLFTPGHSYDVMVVVAESPKLLQTWFAKWRHHTDFMPALVDSSDEEDFVPGPEDTDSDSNDDAEVALRERQVRGVSHCYFTWHDHVDVSLLACAAYMSVGHDAWPRLKI